MEETLEGGRGPPWAVAPLEREREREREVYLMIIFTLLPFAKDLHFLKGV
jgi:hypothetical protein